MSPARYAWRGSLFCFCFCFVVPARWLGALARSAPRGRVVLLIVWVSILLRWCIARGLPSWCPWPTVPAVRWAGRHCGAVVMPARGVGRGARRSAPSGWVTRGDGGVVDRFGWVSACLHPRFVFQCRCCPVASCSPPAVRSLCRWQGFALAMVGTT
jgi:hypothetical protein